MPFDPPTASAGGWRARLALSFERRGERTVLASRRHDGPLVVQKALHPEGDAPCHAIVLHPPAGIAGGDDLAIEVDAAQGAHALLTTPGAGKWYRSSGAWAKQAVTLRAAAASCLEWLPQETIVFDGARAKISFTAELEPDSRLIAWEIVCLGRTGSGERFETGECRIETRLSRGGKLLFNERGSLSPQSTAGISIAALDGDPVFATMLVAAPEIGDDLLAAAREVTPARGLAAVTRFPGLLVARYRGGSSEAARHYCIELWRRLRLPITGREAVLPRIWRT